jgi:uncharacterized membrane protein
MADRNAPPGWSEDPSRRSVRLAIVAHALAGLAISTYLALYQLGFLAGVWEPFFGEGSRKVLHSFISRLLPFPDAALGALAYLVCGAAALAGGPGRWRGKPWAVLIQGASAWGLGLMSVVLVILQGTVIKAWCTLCLASALNAVFLPRPATRELLATLGYLGRERRRGTPLRRALAGSRGDEEEPPDPRRAAG